MKEKKPTYHRLWFLLLVPFSFGITYWAKQNPDTVEKYYALGFYPAYARLIGGFTAKLPFSLAELLLILVVAAVLLAIVFTTIATLHKSALARRIPKTFVATVLAVASVLYFLFTIGGGLNYYRYNFAFYSNFSIRDSSEVELAALCDELIAKANVLRRKLPADENGIMILTPWEKQNLTAETQRAYRKIAAQEPVLALGGIAKAKSVCISEAMSYGQIVGIYVPVTLEANYNRFTPDYALPSAICHELAHASGFMREDEANYIAFLVCRQSDNVSLQYSGMMLALSHSLSALNDANSYLYYAALDRMSDSVKADMQAYNRYWEKYDTLAGDISEQINDVYLQLNDQSDGVASYGRMVDLLLADYRQTHGLD